MNTVQGEETGAYGSGMLGRNGWAKTNERRRSNQTNNPTRARRRPMICRHRVRTRREAAVLTQLSAYNQTSERASLDPIGFFALLLHVSCYMNATSQTSWQITHHEGTCRKRGRSLYEFAQGSGYGSHHTSWAATFLRKLATTCKVVGHCGAHWTFG